MKDKTPEKIVRLDRKDQIIENRARLSMHSLVREVHIAHEDVSRMSAVFEKWIEDDARYDFFIKQLSRIVPFCEGLNEDNLKLFHEIEDDIELPSSRDTSERIDVVTIARVAIKKFTAPKKIEPPRSMYHRD